MKVSKYNELPLWEKMISKVMVYYETVWAERKYNALHHKKWLANFTDSEKINSLYLLTKFMFFGTIEIREMLVALFRDKYKYGIVEKIRKANSDTTNSSVIESHFKLQLDTTRFVSLGGASESGGHMLYLFRQVNKLPTKLMKNSSELLHGDIVVEPNVTKYIFIDDFCGSGETAKKGSLIISKMRKSNPHIVFSYYSLCCTEEGFNSVISSGVFDKVETIFMLDKSFKCFQTDSRYYAEGYLDIDKVTTKTFSAKYGKNIIKNTPVDGHPLGFANGQLLLAFAHNTPDNTLPIFWGDQNWQPFFVRYTKTH